MDKSPWTIVLMDNWLFFGRGNFKNVFESTHKAEIFLFSVLPSIFTFVFDLNLGYFGLLGAQMG